MEAWSSPIRGWLLGMEQRLWSPFLRGLGGRSPLTWIRSRLCEAGVRVKVWLKSCCNLDERIENGMSKATLAYVLDTSAWFTLIEDEAGSDTVQEILEQAKAGPVE